jgi:Zn finger protein HypA/HybF involved in hydrogenase expression
MMHAIERFLIAAAFLMTGTLIFVSVYPSWQSPQAAVRDGNDCAGAPAVKTINTPNETETSPFVANPFCLACHLDFDEEELALQHEIFGIGCERCHGESFRHRSDEANVTPPEIMYPKERINPSCMSCHPRQDIRDTKDHQPILEAGLSSFEEATPVGENAKKYCTDCHGSKHRVMRVRAVYWDKATGALLKKGN